MDDNSYVQIGDEVLPDNQDSSFEIVESSPAIMEPKPHSTAQFGTRSTSASMKSSDTSSNSGQAIRRSMSFLDRLSSIIASSNPPTQSSVFHVSPLDLSGYGMGHVKNVQEPTAAPEEDRVVFDRNAGPREQTEPSQVLVPDNPKMLDSALPLSLTRTGPSAVGKSQFWSMTLPDQAVQTPSQTLLPEKKISRSSTFRSSLVSLPEQLPERPIYPMTFPDFPMDRRSMIALELYTTERSYVAQLEVVVSIFMHRGLVQGVISQQEATAIFSNIECIYNLNSTLLMDLLERMQGWSEEQKVGDVILKHVDNFSIYLDYCSNFDSAEKLVIQKRKKKEFDQFILACQNDPKCHCGLELSSYLITAVQRVPRYILLLKDLVKKTHQDHPDYIDLEKALNKMMELADSMNKHLSKTQSQKALSALQSKISGLKAYHMENRDLVFEMRVALTSPRYQCQAVLFNDILVFASKDGEVELVFDLAVLWVLDLQDSDPAEKHAISLQTPEKPYTMYLPNMSSKKLWLNHLSTSLEAHIKKMGFSCPDAPADSRRFPFTYSDGSNYLGFFLDAKRHGAGVMQWGNQRFKGDWCEDQMHGSGTLTYDNGDEFVGELKFNKPDGHGVFTSANGSFYKGSWRRGVWHGQGTIQLSDGTVIEGEFRHGWLSGRASLTKPCGDTYVGEWLRNKRNGFGTEKNSDGTTYIGNFQDNLYHGTGEIKDEKGNSYSGSWCYGQKHGTGRFSSLEGSFYDGEWARGLPSGRGQLFLKDHDLAAFGCYVQTPAIYTGQWCNGNWNGPGSVKYKSGSTFSGSFDAGEMCGLGTMVYADGAEYTGNWIKNQKSGKGVLKTADKATYDGQWLHDREHGEGVLTSANGAYSYEGSWVEGRMEGQGRERLGKNEYSGCFLWNLRHGSGSEMDGVQRTCSNWIRGRKHGIVFVYKNATLQNQEIWCYGRLVSSSKYSIACIIPWFS